MRAIVVSSYGPPDVLTLAKIDAPSPGSGEVTVRRSPQA